MIKCNKCGIEKMESDFYERNKVCKDCYKKAVTERQRTERGRAQRAIYSKTYKKTKKGKEASKRSSDKYTANPSSKKNI